MTAHLTDGSPGKLGLIAGRGEIAAMAARSARAMGYDLVTIALYPEAAASLRHLSGRLYECGAGQVGRILSTLRREGVTDVLWIGHVDKGSLFRGLFLDRTALSLLKQMATREDDTLLREVERFLGEKGFRLLDQRLFLRDAVVPPALLTRREPDEREWADVVFGFGRAKEIGALQIGQTVVVKDRAIVAVEAAEGTDETVARGCRLAGPGAVVVKVARPSQDVRADLPVVGLGTLEVMVRGGAGVLCFEADRTLFLERERAVELADREGIAILSYAPAGLPQKGAPP